MPITTFQNILSTDKLQSGFRAKFNANVALLITDIVDNGNGTATVQLQGGTNFQIDLTTSFYTKTQVQNLINAVQPAVWGGISGNVVNQTDVVGNLGVITPIDNLLFSVNFAVDAADTDNPFFGSPASGFASFSVPGISGTGWQLLIKEDVNPEIKFRLYYGGIWYPWVNIGSANVDVIELTGSDPQDYDYTYAGDVEDPGLQIYAETYYTDPTYGPTLVPYTLQYFKIPATNHIIFRRSDVGDLVRVTVKP